MNDKHQQLPGSDTCTDPIFSLKAVFDENGNFYGLDPYRKYDLDDISPNDSPERRENIQRLVATHDLLFDEKGNVRSWVYRALPGLINENSWHWTCDAVRLVYAQDHGVSTKGSYPATYMWR